MVDRGRSPIRPTPSHSAAPEEETDPASTEDKLEIETSSLSAGELTRLLEDDDQKSRTATVEITAPELDALLAKARPDPTRPSVPEPPPSRPMLTTAPYDEVTAYALLDKDAASPQPATAVEDDAPEIETVDDDSSDVDAIEADVADEKPVVATPAAAIIPAATSSAPPSQSIPPAGPASASPPAIAPLPAAITPSPMRASLPSASAEWPGEKDRKRKTRMILLGVGGLAATGLLYLAFTEPDAAPAAPPAAVVEPTPAPPATVAPKPQSAAEIEARKALSRLRDGMGDCVRHVIGSVPGSSPAVPAAMKQASGAGYTALAADWKTAVWSCAKFHHDAPMQFQLQWQSAKPGAEAVGLAWIDDNGDGEPDRVLGFRATAKGSHDVDLGEIAPMEMRPVLPVR
ncbi:MAG: hypothetical protein ABJE95_39125 [Byssovorax sp.]